MHTVVLANTAQKDELIVHGVASGARITWINKISEFNEHKDAEAFICFDDDLNKKNLDILRSLAPAVTCINDVINETGSPGKNLVRFNGWSGFLNGKSVEAAGSEPVRQAAERIFKQFNRTVEWTENITGFISPRIVAMIINEAYFALSEKVATKEDIDTAMKLGTNYPFGPFEWASKIGIGNVYRLLKKLSGESGRYQPAPLLKKEASA